MEFSFIFPCWYLTISIDYHHTRTGFVVLKYFQYGFVVLFFFLSNIAARGNRGWREVSPARYYIIEGVELHGLSHQLFRGHKTDGYEKKIDSMVSILDVMATLTNRRLAGSQDLTLFP